MMASSKAIAKRSLDDVFDNGIRRNNDETSRITGLKWQNE